MPKARNFLQKVQEKKTKVQGRLHELKAQRKEDEQALHLQTCPTCKQEVTEDHKVAVKKELEAHNKSIDQQLVKFNGVLSQVQEKEDAARKKIEALLQQREKYLLLKQKFDEAQKKKEGHKLLIEKQTAAKKKIELLSKQQEELASKLAQYKKVDDAPLRKNLLEQERAKEQAVRELSGLQTRQRLALKALDELSATLKQKKETDKKLKQLSGLKHWMQELFTPLVKRMEKRVLLRVYQEFQNFFTQWFELLVPDQELQVRLDEDFTPLVQQNGFDTSVTNLSGGEKTGVALAYRLALNKVLNDYFSSLHTKGLLILDEPTDGFSSEQIDRLREVFEEIGVKQLILVSHEPRLESVADNVVRVQKQAHSSSLI